jgi:hypothetical protein
MFVKYMIVWAVDGEEFRKSDFDFDLLLQDVWTKYGVTASQLRGIYLVSDERKSFHQEKTWRAEERLEYFERVNFTK